MNDSLIAVLILIATVSAARASRRLVQSPGAVPYRSGRIEHTIFVNIARVVVLTMGALVTLEEPWACPSRRCSQAPLGVGVGLAVALALQGHPGQPLRGRARLLASKTVQPGDRIRLGSGGEGCVVDISWRNTVRCAACHRTNTGDHPQRGRLARTNMTNFTQPEQKLSILVQVGVGYDSDLEHVELESRWRSSAA
ncbi:hypothetical protein ACU686_22320 [Yinghuangia aomiensis]